MSARKQWRSNSLIDQKLTFSPILFLFMIIAVSLLYPSVSKETTNLTRGDDNRARMEMILKKLTESSERLKNLAIHFMNLQEFKEIASDGSILESQKIKSWVSSQKLTNKLKFDAQNLIIFIPDNKTLSRTNTFDSIISSESIHRIVMKEIGDTNEKSPPVSDSSLSGDGMGPETLLGGICTESRQIPEAVILPPAFILSDAKLFRLTEKLLQMLEKQNSNESLAASTNEPINNQSSATALSQAASLIDSFRKTPSDPWNSSELKKWLGERQKQLSLQKNLLSSMVSEALDGRDETLTSAIDLLREEATSDINDSSDSDEPLMPEKALQQIGGGMSEGAKALARVIALAARRKTASVTETSLNSAKDADTSLEGSAAEIAQDGENPGETEGETTLGLGLPPESMPSPYPAIRNGAIIGVIETENGELQSGAVRVEARGDGIARVTHSGIGGRFRISDLPLGEYDVIYIAPGFTPSSTTLQAIVENGATYSMPGLTLNPAPSENPGSTAGRVLDAIDGSPLEGVALMLAGHTTLSDSQGSFSFQNMAPGDATLKAVASGYKAYSSDIIIVAGAQVNPIVTMEPASGRVGGIITLEDSSWPISWDQMEGQIIISVKGLVHQTVNVNDGVFSIQVPAMMDSYTVELRAPYCEVSSVVVPGPLYPGGTLMVNGLTLKRRFSTTDFRIISEKQCTGSLYIQFKGGFSAGPSSNFSGTTSSLISGVRLPMGPLSVTVRGASGLTPAHQDGSWEEIVTGPASSEMVLYIKAE
ncbi:MAG: hypothetical protein CVV64_05145 [Candidatus Wallbacteria bacterium HGW-Wallbacteria-1]|jgi:hypothetical protein|uniref:Carboxypeptidase regulatory-like domain-containing protein n=1 Tax=Candidatus Wallbacteria bacterium HGW-Wallbacteria-1 TaxID=2013854 RepID=A0A2N1PS47_9BACT|nr:MAG: hypothetical protein CVV64_05145 [Candidatus Wallbacteria bacterium HGW-Wallbacteria-1]